MSDTVYSFADQLQVGREAEDALAAWLRARGCVVKPATFDEERQGIDFWVWDRDGVQHSLQVKNDVRAAGTGNAFVETVDNDVRMSPGWAAACTADFLVYVVGEERIWLRPSRIRETLHRWRGRVGADVRHVAVQNDGYRTHGWVLPLSELRRIASREPA